MEDGSTEVLGTHHPDKLAMRVDRCACLGFQGPFSKMWLHLPEFRSFRNESRRLLVAAVPRTEAYSAVWFVPNKDEGQERLPQGVEKVTVLDGKAGTFLQPSGRFRSIPTIGPVLVGLVVNICVSGRTVHPERQAKRD